MEKWFLMAVIWGACFYVLSFIARYLGARPGWF
jgi:hypothetical protein